jgi:peptidoglycan/xylan/chitin deacetylase (PgdA/CDA1 family)
MVHRTPFFLPLLYPALTWRIPVESKQIFLTFDDGPVPGPTEFVLETLAKSKAKATFFCIGDNVRKYPHIFDTILAQGHTVANHTYNHVNGWQTGVDEYVENILKCSEVMQSLFQGKVNRMFRPPYGRITRKQINALSQFQIIMWDVLTIDYNSRLKPDRCLRNSIAATRNGSIVVFHDSLKAVKNLTYVLPLYLEHFSNQGFEFNVIPS